MSTAQLDLRHRADVAPPTPAPRPFADTCKAAAKAVVTSTGFQAIVLAVLAWPWNAKSLNPQTGLDPSWEYLLEHAATTGTDYGTQIAFSYGPLGFLFIPHMYEVPTAVASFIVMFFLQVAMFYLLLGSLRTRMSQWLALLISYLAGAIVVSAGAIQVLPEILHPEIVLIFVLAAGILAVNRSEPPSKWWWYSLGAFGAIFSLSLGGVAGGMVVLLLMIIVFAPGRRLYATGRVALGALAAGATAWFTTGNGIGNIAPFVKNYIEVASGYTAAQENFREPLHVWLVAIADTAFIGLCVYLACRHIRNRRRVAIISMTALVMWFVAKESFVRPDGNHVVFYTAVAPLVVAALAPLIKRRGLFVGALVVTSCFALLAVESVPQSIYRPDLNVRGLSSEIHVLSSEKQRHDLISLTREIVRKAYRVPPTMVDEMRHHTVDVAPLEELVTWAYPRVLLDNLPGVQDYQAYTTSLDRLDAQFLEGPRAPQEILRQHFPLTTFWDNELPYDLPPFTQVVMECRYSQVSSSPEWQLSKRVPNRCGRVVSVGHVTSETGKMVTVPSPRTGSAVLARFSVSLPLSWKIDNLLTRPSFISMVAVLNNNVKARFRFVVGTEGELHIIQPASTLDYSKRFTPPVIKRLEIVGPEGSRYRVSISFFTVSMSR